MCSFTYDTSSNDAYNCCHYFLKSNPSKLRLIDYLKQSILIHYTITDSSTLLRDTDLRHSVAKLGCIYIFAPFILIPFNP